MTHLVDEEALPTSQQSYHRRGPETLSMDKFLQVELLFQPAVRLGHLFLVILVAQEICGVKTKLLDALLNREIPYNRLCDGKVAFFSLFLIAKDLKGLFRSLITARALSRIANFGFKFEER